jgi:hypothetical protein
MEFLHPWYMAAGGALVASPILIHLINRMRFKRIRWAAMEFLLKSQKRNRRRLIIEQMILLLLRILLVLLAAFLVARLLYAGSKSKGSTHVVIIDDTMSMGDRTVKDGKTETAFDAGRRQVVSLAGKAGQSSAPQHLKVYLLSQLRKPTLEEYRREHKKSKEEAEKALEKWRPQPIFDKALTDRSGEDLERAFTQRQAQATLLHASPLSAFELGRQQLREVKEGQKALYVVSDFRDRDWTEGKDAKALLEQVQGAVQEGVAVNLVDVAAPNRDKSKPTTKAHDNLAIIDFSADQRVALPETKVQFTVSVMNYGTTTPQKPPFLNVKVNGQPDAATSTQIKEVPSPGQLVKHTFEVSFPERKGGAIELKPSDSPEEKERKRRLDRQFFHIQVDIGKEDEGLNVDNVRDLIMEVRGRVPSLLVDGNKDKGPRSDYQLFTKASESSKDYDLEEVNFEQLMKIDLSLYPSIVLLNVAKLPEPVVDRLARYVERGGSICYFMGEQVAAAHYNDVLWTRGLFPVRVLDRPFDPIYAEGTDFRGVDPATNLDKRIAERERRQQNGRDKVLFPLPEHPLVATLYYRFFFHLKPLSINVYWKAQPRSDWDPTQMAEKAKDDKEHVYWKLSKAARGPVQELVVLPKQAQVKQYQATALNLASRALQATQELARAEGEMRRYVGPMEAFQTKISRALERAVIEGLGPLALVLEEMLNDPGEKDNPARPRMPDLWNHLSMRELAEQIKSFRNSVLYGDPLVVSKAVGKGRVVAVMTAAGTIPRKGVDEDAVAWNNWGEGNEKLQESYPIFVNRLQEYLVSQGGETTTFVLGKDRDREPILLPARLYEEGIKCEFVPQPDLGEKAQAGKQGPGAGQKVVPHVLRLNALGKEVSASSKDVENYLVLLPEPGPGVLKLTAFMKGAKGEKIEEVRSFAFNVDAAEESNLKRAGRGRLDPDYEKGRTGITIRTPGEVVEAAREEQPDTSKSPLLYLFFIIILVVEQAMAVHLSHHLRGTEAAGAGSSKSAPAAAAA